MEINITRFFKEAGMIDYSASVAKIGRDAGEHTWQSALRDVAEYNLLDNADKLENFADYVVSTGGWTGEEVDDFSNDELQALCIQFVAGWVREAFPGDRWNLTDEDWSDYHARSEEGSVAGVFSRDSDGDIYCYFGI